MSGRRLLILAAFIRAHRLVGQSVETDYHPNIAFLAAAFAACMGMIRLLPAQDSTEPEHHIGIVHRDITESSPFASATISVAQNSIRLGADVKIHVTVTNRSGHDIGLSPMGNGPSLVFDARDSSGKLVAETDRGCVVHFFSPCHKFAHSGSPPMAPFVPAHKKLEWDAILNAEYVLDHSGTYTVIGYVQHIFDENGNDLGTFKTNKVQITVQ